MSDVESRRINKYIEKYKPRKVLVIGNGFDMAHGLLTSYSDFLRIMKNPDEFLSYYNHMIDGSTVGVFENHSIWEQYLNHLTSEDKDDVYKMIDLLKNNSWVHYYKSCNAEINGWVDFEREMIPVISMFNFVVSNGSQNLGIGSDNYALVSIENVGIRRIASLWPKYIKETRSSGSNTDGIILMIEKEYSDRQYGVIGGKILRDLKADLDEFVKCFCIYLDLFAREKEGVSLLSLFEKIEVSYIINFNYTETVYHYSSLRDAEINYIHGSVVNSGDRKMIFGVNRVENDAEYRFKEFEKRYQRICNSTKQFYKRLRLPIPKMGPAH